MPPAHAASTQHIHLTHKINNYYPIGQLSVYLELNLNERLIRVLSHWTCHVMKSSEAVGNERMRAPDKTSSDTNVLRVSRLSYCKRSVLHICFLFVLTAATNLFNYTSSNF